MNNYKCLVGLINKCLRFWAHDLKQAILWGWYCIAFKRRATVRPSRLSSRMLSCVPTPLVLDTHSLWPAARTLVTTCHLWVSIVAFRIGRCLIMYLICSTVLVVHLLLFCLVVLINRSLDNSKMLSCVPMPQVLGARFLLLVSPVLAARSPLSLRIRRPACLIGRWFINCTVVPEWHVPPYLAYMYSWWLHS